MAGTVTVDYGPNPSVTKPIRKVVIDWTTDGSGNADGTTTRIEGAIVRVTTNPSATAPTDDYDVVLTDEDGLDVLAGRGANRDTANSEHFVPGVAFTDGTTTSVAPVVVDGPLTLAVTNGGAAKQGWLILYVR